MFHACVQRFDEIDEKILGKHLHFPSYVSLSMVRVLFNFSGDTISISVVPVLFNLLMEQEHPSFFLFLRKCILTEARQPGPN